MQVPPVPEAVAVDEGRFVTAAELDDLTALVRSGQASLLRRVSGMTQDQLGAKVGVTGMAVNRYEARGHIPRDDGIREAYYRALCSLRDVHGTVTLASPEPCLRGDARGQI